MSETSLSLEPWAAFFFQAARGDLHHSGTMRTKQQVAKCCPPASACGKTIGGVRGRPPRRGGGEQRRAKQGDSSPFLAGSISYNSIIIFLRKFYHRNAGFGPIPCGLGAQIMLSCSL